MTRLATLDQDLEESLQESRKDYIKALENLLVYLLKRLEKLEP